MKMESQIRLVNIELILPNRFQPRLQFDSEAMNELAASIKEHGIIQPLVLRRLGDKFEIIAGERRYKASQLAGLTTVPAIISDLDDNESAEVAIIENIQRKNLSAIEEAKSYKKLLDRHYVTQDQLSKRLGKSQSAVANKIRLLNLAPEVQNALIAEKISERHARSLLRLTDKLKQVELLNKIINERLTVKQLETLINEVLGSYNKPLNQTGGINANSRIDINVENLKNNTQDIIVDGPINKYSNEVIPTQEEKKDSLFFNNLENKAANMDTSLNIGFNPFQTSSITPKSIVSEYETLEGLDDELEEEDQQQKEQAKAVVEQPKEIVVKDEVYENMSDVVKGLKNVIKKAKNDGIAIDTEEFDFDSLYQFVIKVTKD